MASGNPAIKPRSSEERMAKDQPKIWCTDLKVTTKYIKHIEYEGPNPLPEDHWYWRFNEGQKIDRDEFPDRLVARQLYASLPSAFTIVGGVPIVNKLVKDVLDLYRLGESHLVEVPIWSFDMYQTFDGPFYFLNIAEKRSVFLPEQNPDVTQYGNGKYGAIGRDTPSVVVRSEPPVDIDLWMDPDIVDLIFVSAPLAKAIKTAKIRNFKLFPCPAAE